MTKYWVFTQGGAWRNPKPTGNPYICEQCRLDARSRSNPTLHPVQAVTKIELAPGGRMRRLRGAVVGGKGGPKSSLKTRKETMIRKKWIDGEAVLSVETEDEFWKAVTTGEPVELTHELADKIGLMEEDVGTVEEIKAARYDPSD